MTPLQPPHLAERQNPPRRVTRRALLGGVAALATGLAGCAGGQSYRWARRYLTVATTGGALRQALHAAAFDPFVRATGCTIQDLSLSSREIDRALRRQWLSGRVQWDVVILDAPSATLAAQRTPGLFSAGDPPIFALDTLALAYREGPVGEHHPATWAEVWSGTTPGTRLWPDAPVGLLEIALLADGAATESLYPLDLDRAFAALARFREQDPGWWQSSKLAGEALALGKADLVLGYGGEHRAAIDGGAAATIAALPMPLLPLTINLTQGSPNQDIARDFAAYVSAGEAQAAIQEGGYGIRAPLPPTALPLDLAWWRDQGPAALARFEQWRGTLG